MRRPYSGSFLSFLEAAVKRAPLPATNGVVGDRNLRCSGTIAAAATLNTALTGLNSSEAAARLKAGGPNLIEIENPDNILGAVLKRLGNPLVLILLAAAGVLACTGDMPSFIIIAAIVLMSVALDVFQEHQAQGAAARLRAQVSLKAMVLRDGAAVEIAAAQVVPGDVVLLAAGDLIPADGRLIEARDLYVNEALLTGEAFPAEKTDDLTKAKANGGLPSDHVYMGSSVVSGTAKALIYATGRQAQLGSIAHALHAPPPPTAFAIGLRDFALMIVRLTIMLVLFVLLINLLWHRPPLQSFLFAVALAVGLTPELLPMVVSVTLARGAVRMSAKDVIIKRLSAIHDLGGMDILCSDKTGTLTEAKIALIKEVDVTGRDSSGVLRLAQINALFETGLKSPLDEAILAADCSALPAWRKIDEAPFDFERRRVGILVEAEAGRRLLIVKGAPEAILGLAASCGLPEGDVVPLNAPLRQASTTTLEQLGGDGLRVLCVAWRQAASDCEHADPSDESLLTIAGFLGFLDPPKADAGRAVADIAALGVTVKILTGDDDRVTRHVCAAIGLPVKGVLTGAEVAGLSDEALSARLDDTTLFCRMAPAQKSRIIAALRRKGHVVGYIGDGSNDAPSLHAANVGFSVDTAVDVAKDAASIILLRKDLSVLAEGVREGRRTYANILKYIMMGTSSNFGNMFSMAGGVLFLPFLPMLPIQILLNNLLYDLSETAIPLDRVDPAMLARPRRWDLKVVRRFMFILGPLSSLFDFATFGLLLVGFKAGPPLFHTGWFVESLATQVLVIFIIRTAHPLQTRPHPLLVASSLSAVAVALVLPYSPFASWFGFSPLPFALLAALAALTAAYLLAVHQVKLWLFARYQLA
jgi:Mg2+-importing ATPase